MWRWPVLGRTPSTPREPVSWELWGQCPLPFLPGLPHGAGRPEQSGHGPRPKLAGTTWQSVGGGAVDRAVSPIVEGGLCGLFAVSSEEKHGPVSTNFHGFPNSAITRPVQSLKKQPALGFPRPGLNTGHLLGTNCLECHVLFNET